MAVKVTGFFQNPKDGLIYQSPILGLVPHLYYPGEMSLEVRIIPSGSMLANGGLSFNNIPVSLFNSSSISNSYNAMIYALEGYVITNLSGSTPINAQSTFQRWDPISGSNIL